MYTTALQLLDLFGDNEMALLSAPESPAVDGVLLRLTVEAGDRSAYSAQDIADADQAKARLDSMIVEAGLEIDSYISPRYNLPLTQIMIDGSALPRKCADISRYLLMDNRTTEEVETRYKNAIKWLRDISMNKASLGIEDTGVASPAGHVVTKQGVSGTDWGSF